MDLGFFAQANPPALKRMSSFVSISSLGSTSTVSLVGEDPPSTAMPPLLLRHDSSRLSVVSAIDVPVVTARQPVDPPGLEMPSTMSTDEEDDDDSKTFATCLEEEETNDEDDETKEKALFPYEAREEEIRQQFEKLRKQKGYWLKSILLGESGAPSIDMVSEIHIEGDDDCWVERFYVNKDRVRIRYFRSIGSNRFFRREPPCGASRIIYMWDLIRGYTLSPDEQKCMMERLDNLQEIVKNMEGVSEEEYLGKIYPGQRMTLIGRWKRWRDTRQKANANNDEGSTDQEESYLEQEPYVYDSF